MNRFDGVFIPPIGQAQTGSAAKPGAMPIAGCIVSLATAIFALHAAHKHNYYASEVYGMTPGSHRRFGGACLLFAVGFALALRFDALSVPLWGGFAVGAILYGASFVRGFGEGDR